MSVAARIMLLARSLNYGGTERQLVELAKGLHRRGHAVVVVTFYDEGQLLGDLRGAGVPVITLGKRGRWDVVRFGWRLVTAVRRLRPEVVYSFLVEPNLQAVLLRLMRPRLRVVWGARSSNVDLTKYGWLPRASFRLSRLLARFADLIIVNSDAGAKYLQGQGFPAGKMRVVFNGIDFARFRPDPAAGESARAAWHVPPRATVIGTVGRLDPMKDHRTFLEAAAVLARQSPDAYFVSIGDGPDFYRRELRSLAASLGLSDRLVWAGSQHDMNAAYNGFDVCCLASAFGEGFPNVLGEALACGVPCVSTNVGDAARILDGCGIIVPPGDPGRLADGIGEALRRSDAARRQACRETAEQRMGLQRMIVESERLLLALLAPAAAP